MIPCGGGDGFTGRSRGPNLPDTNLVVGLCLKQLILSTAALFYTETIKLLNLETKKKPSFVTTFPNPEPKSPTELTLYLQTFCFLWKKEAPPTTMNYNEQLGTLKRDSGVRDNVRVDAADSSDAFQPPQFMSNSMRKVSSVFLKSETESRGDA